MELYELKWKQAKRIKIGGCFIQFVDQMLIRFGVAPMSISWTQRTSAFLNPLSGYHSTLRLKYVG
jgi:hypothetical protein